MIFNYNILLIQGIIYILTSLASQRKEVHYE